MKTLKFILIFNFLVYTSILFTLIFSCLLSYKLDFDTFEDLLLRYHSALPLLFSIVNATLLLIKVAEILTLWSWKFVKNLVFYGKNYKKTTDNADFNFSASL